MKSSGVFSEARNKLVPRAKRGNARHFRADVQSLFRLPVTGVLSQPVAACVLDHRVAHRGAFSISRP
ncbi:MAG: hypothetical protein R6U98_24450 [Pirellulaceae bacterium]